VSTELADLTQILEAEFSVGEELWRNLGTQKKAIVDGDVAALLEQIEAREPWLRSLGDLEQVAFLATATFSRKPQGSWYQVAPEGTLEFNVDGTSNAGTSTITDITLLGLADGGADITIAGSDISFANSTQLNEPATVLAQTQTNTNGLHAQLGRLDAAINQILTFRAEVGARLNSADVAADAVGVLKDRTLGQRSQIEDADVLAAYSDFARLQNAFEAALQSASQLIQPSLLDFLR